MRKYHGMKERTEKNLILCRYRGISIGCHQIPNECLHISLFIIYQLCYPALLGVCQLPSISPICLFISPICLVSLSLYILPLSQSLSPPSPSFFLDEKFPALDPSFTTTHLYSRLGGGTHAMQGSTSPPPGPPSPTCQPAFRFKRFGVQCH